MSQFIPTLPVWPEPLVPATGLLFFYDPATDQEYRILPSQVGAGAGAGATTPLATVDLLELTTDQMSQVMGLAFTDCDAAPGDSPTWSYPGHQFDAIYNGKNCHFYCTRGTYDPAAPAGTTGQGPAWHYTLKLG